MTYPTIIIGGPTASGKSDFALRLAQKVNGVIINGDSMQVYKDVPILTATPYREDHRQNIPHKLYSYLEAFEKNDVMKWLIEAENAIEESKKNQCTPIIVGGTGFYLSALIHGLSPIPPISLSVQEELMEDMNTQGLPALFQRLQSCDPQIALKIDPCDRQRILRALGVFQTSQKPLSFWQKEKGAPLKGPYLAIHIDSPREILKKRADERFLKMLQEGGLEEAHELWKKEYHLDTCPLSRVIGVKELGQYFNGKIAQEEAITLSQIHTRQYIKRQQTWFKNQWTTGEIMRIDHNTPLQIVENALQQMVQKQ